MCRNSAETEAVLKALTSDDNTYFTLYMFKNGFQKYEAGKYCDIKLILKSTNKLNEEFEELIEVQLIQSIFIEFKRCEHKI